MTQFEQKKAFCFAISWNCDLHDGICEFLSFL